jgi:hypothetical protein
MATTRDVSDRQASDPLPSVRALHRATVLALGVAALLGVGVVLPAETGRDPLGSGQLLGLAEMGRIKTALAREEATSAPAAAVVPAGAVPIAIGSNAGGDRRWRDSLTVTLAPRQGIELKLTMRTGARAFYAWTAGGAEVYFDRHGDLPSASEDAGALTYAKGSAPADTGTIVAAFDGIHGWFFRNRNNAPVRITLRTGGDYLELKELQ